MTDNPETRCPAQSAGPCGEAKRAQPTLKPCKGKSRREYSDTWRDTTAYDEQKRALEWSVMTSQGRQSQSMRTSSAQKREPSSRRDPTLEEKESKSWA